MSSAHDTSVSGTNGPWKQKHGSAPRPFNGAPAAGLGGPKLTQDAPGSPHFTLRSPMHEAVGWQDGADAGTYVVSMGDGSCAETHPVEVGKDGKVDLSEFRALGSLEGQTMIQLTGPLNDDPSVHGPGMYLDAKGRGTDLMPSNHAGAVVRGSESAVVPVDANDNGLRNAATGLPVVDAGQDSVPLRTSRGMGLPRTSDTPVDVTYRDADSADLVTIKGVGTIKAGSTDISGPSIAQLPSGRYNFSFTDGAGHRQHVFVLVGDGKSTTEQLPLYDGLG